MNYQIEPLAIGDVERLKSLMDCFGEAFDEPQTYQRKRPDDGYLADLLASKTFIALVALAGNELVGGLTAYELKKPEQERSEIYIYDLAVSIRYRQKGIATSLIEALKPVARERKAWVMLIQADTADEPAARLYTKLGSREDVLHFDIPTNSRGSV